MEAYQAFTDLRGMMKLTQGFVQAAAMAACGTLQIEYQGNQLDLGGEWRVATMLELANEYAGEEVSFDRTREELVSILEKNGGHADNAWGKGKLIAEIFEAVAEEKLIQPTFVTDHPLKFLLWQRRSQRIRCLLIDLNSLFVDMNTPTLLVS